CTFVLFFFSSRRRHTRFSRDWSSDVCSSDLTLIIAVSIPTSVLLTFLTVYMLGYSLNMLTLIGLGLGVGMMVDSSIVILESIYRSEERRVGKECRTRWGREGVEGTGGVAERY